MSVEKRVKTQFAKVFRAGDWRLFKRMAEVYLKRSAHVRRRDLRYVPSDLRLLARNAEKRLLIGIGVELLLKALYLKHGFAINRPRKKGDLRFPFRFDEADGVDLDPNETVTFNALIQSLSRIPSIETNSGLDPGLRVAKVFRNKEGHVVTGSHEFQPHDYRTIEEALVQVYERGFDERLQVRFAMAPRERAVWRVSTGG